MILNENYRTAIQKYGKDIVIRLTHMGLPDNYLLAACRFVNETNKSLSEIVSLFKEWNKYVVRFTKIDVNFLSFDKFIEHIEDGKISHGIPNVIYQDDIATIGKILRAKDTKLIPIDVWCIHSQRKIENYLQRGYKFFVIRMLSQPLPFTYVMAAVHDGEVEYWDSYNYPHIEGTDGSHEVYQKMLPKSIVNLLYNVAAQQKGKITESKNYKNMKTKKTITESQLRAIVVESIKKTLNEMELSDYKPIIKGKTVNGNEDEFAGMNSYLGKEWLAKIGKLLDEIQFGDNPDDYSNTEAQREVEIIRQCLLRAYQSCMNFCKLHVD